MSVLLSDIKLYAAAVTPEDDSVTGIGGAIDLTKKFDFTDFATACQVVSSDPADTTQSVTLTYRDSDDAIQSLTIFLNGTTPVTDAMVIARALKAVKSGTCGGDVALESQTAETTGTLDGLGTAEDEVILDVYASGDDGFYNGMVFRATGGLGSGSIAEIIKYVGATHTATLSRRVDMAGGPYGDPYANFDATTVYRIAKGLFFDKTPSEILYIVRMGYDSSADVPGGADRDFYLKGYFKHTDASDSGLTLTGCVVKKSSGDARILFTLDTALNGTGTNGGGNNRLVAPVSGVGSFGTIDINVPGGAMDPGDKIGVWVQIDDPNGAVELNTSWAPAFQGTTS